MNKADLLYVRELLATTEALRQEVAAALREAQRLQDQARALHEDSDPTPSRLRTPAAPPPLTGHQGRSR